MASTRKLPPPPLQLLPGSATTSGVDFELKMAALVKLRARRLGLDFSLYRNVRDARPFDDLVLRFSTGGDTYQALIQLKHAEKEKVLTLQAFCPKDERNNTKGDFNLRKYFEVLHNLYFSQSDSEDVKVLREIPLERTRLVIYTNKRVKGSRSRNSPLPNEKSFYLLRELLATNAQRQCFRFDGSDPQVWNLFENEERERLYQQQFLPKLFLFDGQSHVGELDDLIKGEMANVFGENVIDDLMTSLFDKFLKEMQEWVSEPDGRALYEDSGLLEQAIGKELRRRARQATGNGSPLFTHSQYKELLQTLRQHQSHVLSIKVPGVPAGLRAAKLIQALDKDVNYQENWFYIDDAILQDFSPSLMKVLSKSAGMIILDQSKWFLEREVLARLSAALVILSDASEDPQMHLDSESSSVNDVWSWEQLSPRTQEHLMHCPLIFQGEEMKLQDLHSKWPSLVRCLQGPTLGDLLQKKPIRVGQELPPMKSLYIPRVVKHQCVLDDGVLTIASDDDFFVLKGFPEEYLTRLRVRWQECLPSGKTLFMDHKVRKVTFHNLMDERGGLGRVKTKWIEWHHDLKLDGISENIHWLSFSNGLILWEKTEGASRALREYVRGLSAQCAKTSPVCMHAREDFTSWNEGCIVLPDVAGMGKTTFLKHVARTLKESRKADWVIFVSMSDKKCLDDLPHDVQWSDVLKLLLQQHSEEGSPLERTFLEHSLEEGGNVAVLVDAVDEVCPCLKAKALRVLRLLRSRLGRSGGALWVAARSMLEEDLADALPQARALALQPFSRDDQRDYLMRLCAHLDPSECERRVDAVWEATSGLCGVPLYMRMFADVYCRHSNLLTPSISKIQLYKEFVLSSLRIRWEKLGLEMDNVVKRGDRDARLEEYKHWAAMEIFGDAPELQPFIDQSKGDFLEDRQEFEVIEKDGLMVSLVEGKPKFLHYSIAEFLAAWWLLGHFKAEGSIPASLYEDSDCLECLRFFDAFLVVEASSPLHEALLHGGLGSVLKGVDARDAGGRTPLHLAAILGMADAVGRLLGAGAAPDASDGALHWTPLQYASALMRPQHRIGDLETVTHMDVIELLLQFSLKPQLGISRLVTEKEWIEYAIKKDYSNVVQKVVEKVFSWKPGSRVGWHRHEMVFLAAKHESAQVLRVLRNSGFKINRIEKGEKITLHQAAEKGFLHLCEILMDMGADANEKDENGNRPLHCAARSGRKALCALFLDRRVAGQPPHVDAKGHRSLTALHCAVDEGHQKSANEETDCEEEHRELCRFLLDRGADVNARAENGNTALHFACFRGCQRVTRLLLERGVRVDTRDHDGISPLHWAAIRGHVHVCRALLEEGGAHVDARDVEGYTPLHWAAIAARGGVAKLLLANGAHVNAKSERDATALHKAGERGFAEFCQVLLDHGADIDTKDDKSNTALHHAARTDLFHICEILIARGADLEVKDFKGRRPLHRAAKKGHERVCALLLRSGADVHAVTLKGLSALHLAAQGGCARTCEALVQYGARVNLPGTRRYTPLHVATIARNTGAFLALLADGADFSLKDEGGFNVVHMLSEVGAEDMIELLLFYIKSAENNWQRLQESGLTFSPTANRRTCILARTNDRQSALHLAAAAGHEGTCRLLLRLGVPVNARDRRHKRALHYAVENHHFRLAEVLKAEGAIEGEA